jgi:hypothetical protein
MINLKGKLANNGSVLENDKLTNWSPFLYAVVINAKTSVETSLSKAFLIDTGASMTILNASLGYLFKDSSYIDIFKMNYGDGKYRSLKVYDTKIRIMSKEFNILAALDENFSFNYSLLGITRGLDIFNHTIFNLKKRNYLLTIK